MVKDDAYYKNLQSKKFKEANFEKGNKKQGWIKNSRKKYGGEQSPYRDWADNRNNNDPLDLENVTDEETPWTQLPLSEIQDAQWEALEDLYSELKGRQLEIVDLLLSGQCNQSVMATMLNIKPQQVTKILKALQKKINKQVKANENY